MVTSSGNLILSPILINLPPPAIGNIFNVRARLKQKPAPPVANQNVIFLFNEVFFCNGKKEIKEFVINKYKTELSKYFIY